MLFEDIHEGERVTLDGVLVIPVKRLNPTAADSYLFQNGSGALEYFFSTSDGDIAAHLRHFDNKVLSVVDDSLVPTIENHVFPLCGSSYCYINKASIEGVVKGGNEGELCLTDISFASIVKDNGAILRILPDLFGKRAEE